MKIKINGKEVKVKEGETILEVAKRNDLHIPTLCFHSDVKISASCRICIVSANGNLVTACSTKVCEGMEVITNSLEIDKARKTNLELLFSQHQEECYDCIWNLNCKMLDLAKEFDARINIFEDRKSSYPIYHFGSSLEFDSSKCIDCRNCIDICKKQGVEFLDLQENGNLMETVPSEKENRDCVYCGQCIVHCPAGSFEAVGEFEKTKKPLKEKNKTLIFQIAPAVRATIGEEFGLPYGFPSMEKLVTCLKEIGGDKVFDVSIGADFTTVEESKELLERVEENRLPMLTSCCPAWVKFIEFYYPEFIPNLTTVKSPHIILGGLVKKHLAQKIGVLESEVTVISVMPCVAKKEEIEREQIKIGNLKPVDYVMTTREVARFFKNKKIDFKNAKNSPADNPFGDPSSSGVSYGTSGGVMSSAFFNISGEEAEFKEERKGLKVAKVNYNGNELRLAVVHGLGNAKKVLEELKEDPLKYHYVEAMACYGGCIGGGGQSVPMNEEIRKKRKEGLCLSGEDKKVKKAKDNPIINSTYEDFLKDEEVIKEICHTSYKKKEKSFIRKTNQKGENEN